jgi:predicted transcriptional regulator
MSPSPNNYRTLIEDYLSAGWGVEEIAMGLGITANEVREQIKEMRADGTLAKIYGKGTK